MNLLDPFQRYNKNFQNKRNLLFIFLKEFKLMLLIFKRREGSLEKWSMSLILHIFKASLNSLLFSFQLLGEKFTECCKKCCLACCQCISFQYLLHLVKYWLWKQYFSIVVELVLFCCSWTILCDYRLLDKINSLFYYNFMVFCRINYLMLTRIDTVPYIKIWTL